MRAGLSLSGFAEEVLSLRTVREGFSLFAEAFRFSGKSFFQ
ncbi:hypothetical protein CDS [Bradyrhizobium sp.]|nr:hypothetical protein CDS [Bradyrhizobium sp.]